LAIVVTKSQGGQLLDEDTYDAVLTNVEERTESRGKPSEAFLIWKAKVKDPVYDGEDLDEDVYISFATSKRFSRKSYLNKLVTAVLGKDLDEGDQLDLETLVGESVRLTIKNEKRDDGAIFNKVTDYMACKKKKKNVVEEDDEEDDTPKKKRKGKKPSKKVLALEEDDDEDLLEEEDDDEEEEEVKPKKKKAKGKKSKKKAPPPPEDDDDDLLEDEDDEEEEDDPPPVKKKSQKKSKQVVEEDDDDDDPFDF